MAVQRAMLEFYPVHQTPMPRLSTPFLSYARSLVIAAAAIALFTGCATTDVAPPRANPPASGVGPASGAGSGSSPSNVEPPPPNVNLSGFPLPYRQGYADGCASAAGTERKDTTRFAADGNYRTGWQDGLAICRRK
jgi:hypothetical protein